MDASNMDVTIDHIAKDGGKLKAFATVTFDGMFRVHGIRLAESKQSLNIFMPQRVFEKNGKTQYADHWRHRLSTRTFSIPSQPGRATRSRKQSSTPIKKR